MYRKKKIMMRIRENVKKIKIANSPDRFDNLFLPISIIWGGGG